MVSKPDSYSEDGHMWQPSRGSYTHKARRSPFLFSSWAINVHVCSLDVTESTTGVAQKVRLTDNTLWSTSPVK
eukprot:2397429-Amphidinium_carterae.1